MSKDPICGMEVNESEVSNKSEYEGKSYYFCSSSCKAEFDAAPEKYVGKEDSSEHHHDH